MNEVKVCLHGITEIPSELLKSLGKPDMTKLFTLCVIFMRQLKCPQYVITLISQKAGADGMNILKNCFSKSLKQIIYRRIKKLVEAELRKGQFSFQINVGTCNTILILQIILKGKLMFKF